MTETKWVVCGGLAPGAGDAGLGVHHHVVDVVAQRPERQQRGGRVAAGRGHQVGAADLFAVRLGEAVDGLVKQLRRGVRLVPALVAVAVEAEVGGEVHHLQAALAQRLYRGGGRAVRVGHDSRPRALGDRVGVELLQLDRHAIARVELVMTAARVRASRHGRQLERRMPPQDRGGHRAAVAGGADDCDAVRHGAAPRVDSSASSIAARRSATSSSVSVRSGARNSRRRASDLLPSPTCSPW